MRLASGSLEVLNSSPHHKCSLMSGVFGRRSLGTNEIWGVCVARDPNRQESEALLGAVVGPATAEGSPLDTANGARVPQRHSGQRCAERIRAGAQSGKARRIGSGSCGFARDFNWRDNVFEDNSVGAVPGTSVHRRLFVQRGSATFRVRGSLFLIPKTYELDGTPEPDRRYASVPTDRLKTSQKE